MREYALASIRLIGAASLFMLLTAGSALAQDILDAARSGDAATLAKLLPEETPVDPETLSRPLYFAAQRGHSDVVLLLLERGADPDAAFSFGAALHSAARAEHTEVVSILLNFGADTEAKAGEFENTALHEAAESGALATAQLLLSAGANVNARNREDQPPLHLALRRGRDEMAALLLDAGAVPRSVPVLTQAALDKAADDPDAAWFAAGICRGCHELVPGEELFATYPGPTMLDIVDRPKASIDTFNYSEAMLSQEGTWALEDLNQFLGDVYGTVPGTQMYNFPPDMTDEERTAIIWLLTTLTTE